MPEKLKNPIVKQFKISKDNASHIKVAALLGEEFNKEWAKVGTFMVRNNGSLVWVAQRIEPALLNIDINRTDLHEKAMEFAKEVGDI